MKASPLGGAALRASVTDAIHDAVLSGLAQEGFGRLSMESVARRAGVGKAALYRRWSSKDAMIEDVIVTVVADSLPPIPNTGAFRDDIRVVLELFRTQLSDSRFKQIATDLLAESTRNDPLAQMIDEVVMRPRRVAAQAILLAAVGRGELPDDIDFELATDLLIAPTAFRVLILREPIDDARLDVLSDMIVAALRAARLPRSSENGTTSMASGVPVEDAVQPVEGTLRE